MLDTSASPKLDKRTVELIERWQDDHPKCHQAYNCFMMGCYCASPNKCRRRVGK